MLSIVSWFCATRSAVGKEFTGYGSSAMSLRPKPARVNSMLRTMYGSSRANSLGLTVRRCIVEGQAVPSRKAITAHRASPPTSRRMPLMYAFTRMRTPDAAAMTVRMARAGLRAFRSA